MYDLYIMKRTQIYLGDDQAARLRSAARARHRTVSEVIREAIDEKLSRPAEADTLERALKAATGLWSGRTDLGSTEDYIRQVRQDRRGRPPR